MKDKPDKSVPLADARVIPLSCIVESPTNPRKYFDQGKLEELAASIKERGVLEPILVRPALEGVFQIIFGARRFRASKMAGKADMPATVKEFSDGDILVIQLDENDGREDLTPLERAEAYATLAATGLSPAEIAAKLKKRTPDVAAILVLASAAKKVKAALSAGVIDEKYARLIAKIPDHRLQEEALGRIVENFGDDVKPALAPIPYAQAKTLVEEEFMTSLSVAAFDPEDATLSPYGACSACPHLASNNRDLFGEVTNKAVCTNPKDFRLKTENHLRKLKESGYTVLISKKEVQRAFPVEGNPHHLAKDYVDLQSICPSDPKSRTYDALLSKDAKLNAVFALADGHVRRLYPKAALRDALASSGHPFAKERPKQNGNGKSDRENAKLERIAGDAVTLALAKSLRTAKIPQGEFLTLVMRAIAIGYAWKIESYFRRHGYDGTAAQFALKREKVVAERIGVMSDAEKRAFILDFFVSGWSESAVKAEQSLYKDVLKLAGVDPLKVAKQAIDEAKRKAVEAKKTPKPPIAAKTVRTPSNRIKRTERR
jgi:ParB family chromosome partitioning protein